MFSCEFCKIFKNAYLQSSYGCYLWKWCHHNLAEHFEDCNKIPLNLDLHDYFWKLNLMSDICEMKSHISECNLQSNVVHHSPYHMKWIWYSLHQALGIFFCKFYMLSVNVNYAAPFSLLKLLESWFHPSARSSDLLATFLSVFCVFGYLTFLPFVRETFLILWNVKRGVFFATAFNCCLLISHSVFCSVSHRRRFYPHYRNEQSHCVHLKVLQVSGFLLPLSLL